MRLAQRGERVGRRAFDRQQDQARHDALAQLIDQDLLGGPRRARQEGRHVGAERGPHDHRAGEQQRHDPERDDDATARHHPAAHHLGSGVMVISVRSPSRSTVSMLRMTVPSPWMRIVVTRLRSRLSRGSSRQRPIVGGARQRGGIVAGQRRTVAGQGGANALDQRADLGNFATATGHGSCRPAVQPSGGRHRRSVGKERASWSAFAAGPARRRSACRTDCSGRSSRCTNFCSTKRALAVRTAMHAGHELRQTPRRCRRRRVGKCACTAAARKARCDDSMGNQAKDRRLRRVHAQKS